MKKSKWKIAAIAVSIALVLAAAGFVLIAVLDDSLDRKSLPTKSQRGTLALTSSGCCFGWRM